YTRFPAVEAICLGGLTVQLNSLYWELPLHLAELLSAGPHIGMAVQAVRALPLIYLAPRVELRRPVRGLLALGFGASGALSWLKVTCFHRAIILYYLARFICLALLTAAIITGWRNCDRDSKPSSPS
ncbi:MAG: hypothetical protein ACTSSA_11865, partial [Candidatus Freyarchaeota archaeon]